MNKKLVLAACCTFLLSGCKFTTELGGPIIDKLFGKETPLVYCTAKFPAKTYNLTAAAIDTSSFGLGTNPHHTRNVSNDITVSDLQSTPPLLKYTIVDERQEIRRGAPAVAGSTLYYAGVKKAFAMDVEDECYHWAYESPKVHGDIRSSSVLLVDEPTLNKRLMIIGTAEGYVTALNVETGTPVWSAFAGFEGWLTINGVNQNVSQITGGLQYHDGRVYVPIATKEVANAAVNPICCKTHGMLTALDSETGAIVWAYHTTGPAKMQGSNPTKYGPSGVAVWSTPMVDAANNQVIIGTSQNFSKPQTANSDAIVALNIADGTEKWIYKVTPEDYYNASCAVDNHPFNNCPQPVYDFDVVTALLARAGTPDAVIIGADKGGRVFAIDPATASGTTVTPKWITRIGSGGLLGGIHWAMAADNDQVYAGVADFQVPKAVLLGSQLADLLHMYPSQVPCAKSGVYALNIDTGAVVWRNTQKIVDPDCPDGYVAPAANRDHKISQQNAGMGEQAAIFSAAVTVTDNIVWAGSLDGTLWAFDKITGENVWTTYTAVATTDFMGRKGNGGAIDSVGPVIAGNKIYLNSGYSVFNIGGKNEWQGGPGNAIFVYELP